MADPRATKFFVQKPYLGTNIFDKTPMTGIKFEGNFIPGGGLEKPTDRDQQSWVFLNDPKKYSATNRKDKKILSEKQNPKKYPQKHYSFHKSQA